MPYCHNPYTIVLNLIEETIRIYDNFTKREFGKLRYGSPRLRKFLESRKRFFRFLTKIECRRGFVAVNIGNGFKELAAACRGK